MSMYLYKRHLISGLDKTPEYAVEILASNDEVIDYKDSLVDTFTTNYRLDIDLVKPIISINDTYRLELRTEKFTPDLPVYITLTRVDINVDYFLMIKDDILDLEDGFVFCTNPLKFLDVIKPTTIEQYGNDSKIYINYEAYEMTTHYKPVSDFPDGLSIG